MCLKASLLELLLPFLLALEHYPPGLTLLTLVAVNAHILGVWRPEWMGTAASWLGPSLGVVAVDTHSLGIVFGVFVWAIIDLVNAFPIHIVIILDVLSRCIVGFGLCLGCRESQRFFCNVLLEIKVHWTRLIFVCFFMDFTAILTYF